MKLFEKSKKIWKFVCKIALIYHFKCDFIKSLTPLFVCLLLADAYILASQGTQNEPSAKKATQGHRKTNTESIF